ncbi:histone H1-like [Copidosoma floridanum]|uniref:histone H1-like n=1 Tax=Copidosoma floridanum TaxID=29053 RepID=UPI0006C9E5A0|nr:histone H1-like [Copidosoma floridanum]
MPRSSAASVKKSSKMVSAKKPVVKPSHPPTSEMVNAAIGALNEKKGSSLQAIKKYIAGTYVVDVEKMAPLIRKYLKTSVEKNILIQTKGIGASGRFKLTVKPGGKSSNITRPTRQAPATTSPKAKKTSKSPAAKPKTPKPKKSTAAKPKKA